MTTMTALDYTPIAAPRRKARKYTSEERQCWRTPNTPDQPVLHLVARALGGEIGLDPTADDARSVPAYKHITAAEDCFCWPWYLPKGAPKTAFMNPQFDKPHLFLQALVDNTCRSDTLDQSIALLKTGTLHNQKSGAIIKANASAVCHWGAGKVGRMGFIDCNGYQVTGADFDTVLVYFGKDPFLFCQVFDHYGMVSKVVL
jgi:hypothetical protein